MSTSARRARARARPHRRASSSASTACRRRPASSRTRATSRGRDALGPHAAQPARARARSLDRHLRGADAAGRARGAHARRRAGRKTYGLEFPDQPVLAIDRVRYFGEPVALVAAEHPEQARRAAELIVVEYEPLEPVVDPERATESGAAAPGPPDRGPRLPRRPAAERRAHDRDPPRRPRRRRATSSSSGDVRARHPGPGVPRAGVRARRAGRRGRRRRLRRDAVAARRPRAGRAVPRPRRRSRCASTSPASAARSAAARTSRCRSTRALLALHTEPPGEDGLQPRGVVHRPRPPAPGADPGGAPRDARRPARLRADADPARRRRLRVELDRGDRRTRRRSRCGPYTVAERADRVDVRLHEQPAVRRDARLRRRADAASPPRRRWTSSRPRSRSIRSSCGC